MKSRIIVVFAIMGLAARAFAYLGPSFDIERLFNDAPIVCKVIVENTEEIDPAYVNVYLGFSGYSRQEGPKKKMATKAATLEVLHTYKGALPEKITLLFPYAELGDSSSPRIDYAWQTVETGESLILFLKPEGTHYRFWHDVYDSKLPATRKTSANPDAIESFQEDVINSLLEDWTTANPCMRQIGQAGWRKALPTLQAISFNNGAQKYAQSIATRLKLGDRTAIGEALSLFDKSATWPQHYEIENARIACLYLFAKQGSPKTHTMIRSIAKGKKPWLSVNIQNLAKELSFDIMQGSSIIPPLLVSLTGVDIPEKKDESLVIYATLHNISNNDIKGIIQNPARFIVEMDGKFYAKQDFGGKSTHIPPDREIGPIAINMKRFREIKKLELRPLVDPKARGLKLRHGKHKIVIFYKFKNYLVPSADFTIFVNIPAKDETLIK